MDEILHDLHDGRALWVALKRFLVGQRPAENAGMIPVAQNLALQLAQHLRIRADPPVLVQNEHAQLIARIQQLGRRRIVRRAVSIDAHLPQFFDAKVLEPIRQRRAHPRMILMVAHALNFDVLSVDKNAVGWIKAHCAHAKGRIADIRDGVLIADRGNHVVKIGRLRRPQMRASNRHDLGHHEVLAGRHGDR